MPAEWDDRWTRSARALGIDTDVPERDAVLARYAEPHRRYHTLRHLDECFVRLEPVRAHAERVGELEMALWYHDAVCDPLANDNEARSADLAVRAMRRAGLGGAACDRVRALIMATRHDALPAPGDAALLVDVDLGILAAEPARFDEYEEEIRAEYAWVPGPLFRRKRREVLRGFVARERIYVSGVFDDDERRARENLGRSIARLG
ncbi:MAG: N-methyl-D-aspartate receptor NMDAR2C subunit [Gemmatimonadetes bacterium]|nr:N-methyl-D-aspartate receptor NMDAR2C subunit [Gemmatimonadota bacterium]